MAMNTSIVLKDVFNVERFQISNLFFERCISAVDSKVFLKEPTWQMETTQSRLMT